MREVIRRAFLKIFPELSGGLHLDRYARVLAVSDEPQNGGSCERFRPRYAVDLEILTAEGERDASYPVYKDVPLPVFSAGMERGVYGFPETGALVVIGFAYGRPDHPIIRQIYPLGLSLPELKTGELLWQQDAETFQRVDPDGNWTRRTHGKITDCSLQRVIEAVDSTVSFVRHFLKVAADSKEEIGGVKHIEALGGMLLTSGGHIDMAAVDNLNFVTASDCSWIVSRNWNGVTGGNHTYTIKGNRVDEVKKDHTSTVGGNRSLTVSKNLSEVVGGQSTENISGDKKIQAANVKMTAGTFSMSTADGGISFFPLMLDFMQETRAALDVLAVHTHPDAGVINQGGQVSAHASQIGSDRGQLDVMSR
ncbi:bacteriophage T4 gp5 trimerisation domain-containing protein [Maridesulfovibrio bastinii]|uniref:bacteriophage T4 gp5 trimerisation domain-containing protein n=1 Tax=Maridesulfovibrio bastinii TaxID=47157 RepID=UPI000412B964|nr:hypothetical protein [Maridesulfovibrio bastinii]